MNHLLNRLENIEEEKCKIFHDKYARSLNIPLTLQAYLYGDIEKKTKGTNKLQRMNSISSKMSRDRESKDQDKNLKFNN